MEVLKEHQYVIDAIKNVAEDQGLKNGIITEVIQNQKGEGYSALFFLVKVKDTSNGKELDLAVKVAFTNEKLREMMPAKIAFENEIYFYSEVYPVLRQMEEDHGIMESDKFVPKYFKGSVEDAREMLILENLKILGFEVFDKKSFLDHDHISLIFKTYGRFHAYSFALQEQRPNEFNKLVKNFHNVYDDLKDDDSFFNVILKNCGKLAIDCLKLEDNQIKNKLEKLYNDNNYCLELQDLTNENCPHSVILHGDCWSNNMMFRYERTAHKKTLKELRLLDWQVIKIGNPVCDLSYCFYSGASEEVIDNLEQYLKIYHDSLSSSLRELGCDPEKLYPFNTFQEEWKKYAKFGLIMGLCVWKVKMSETEEIVDFSDGNTSVDDFSASIHNASFNKEGYVNIIRKILYHMCEIGVL